MTELSQVEAVIGILMDWADWQRGEGNRLGYPSRSSGFQSGYVSSTFDEMCRVADIYRCKIVDTCIDDLESPAQKAAIYHRYVFAVFRMRNYEDTLAEAHVELMQAFKRKGVL